MPNRAFFPNHDMLLASGGEQSRWHEEAAAVRAEEFGDTAFVRGVVEVSNYCRENCAYCGMRRENKTLARYRAQHEQLAELLIHHRPESVTDINIQTGEDPVAAREVVLPLVAALKRETSLGVSVCLGTLNAQLYAELREAGAAIYIVKFETSDRRQYRRFFAPGDFTERVDHIRWLAKSGWSVSSGFIAGLPDQQKEELLGNFALANVLPLDGCSVSPFIPGEETPLAGSASGSIDLALNCMAALRLMRPEWVIPAVSALNLAEPGLGYRRGLRAGANLVTINLTPTDVRGDYVLYKRERFIMTENRILEALASEGLEPSRRSLADFYAERRALRSGALEAVGNR